MENLIMVLFEQILNIGFCTREIFKRILGESHSFFGVFSSVKFNLNAVHTNLSWNCVSRWCTCFCFVLFFFSGSARKEFHGIRQTSILCTDTLFIANEFIFNWFSAREYRVDGIQYAFASFGFVFFLSLDHYSCVNVLEMTLFAWDSF